MAIVTVRASDGAWDKARVAPTGHFPAYFPANRDLALYDPAGKELARVNISSGVRDFDIFIAGSGEVVVQFSDYNNDQGGWSWKRWTTGVMVAVAAPPPPPPPPPPTGGNAALKAEIIRLAGLIT